ncbi:MAG: hypothetical protein RL486_978, partial [Actinomycetota bacterium]
VKGTFQAVDSRPILVWKQVSVDVHRDLDVRVAIQPTIW